MVFPIALALAGAQQVGQQYQQPGAQGQAPPGLFGKPGSLFELQSLFKGPDASDPYGQFKPGGSFAPPTLPALLGAFQGKNTALTFATALAPGIGQAFGGLFGGGESRGNMRRAGARDLVARTPGLQVIRDTVLAQRGPQRHEGNQTAAEVAAVVAAVLRQSPDAVQALGAVLERGRQLGGFGKAQGEEANALGDVLKWTFGQGTVPKKGAPGTDLIVNALLGSAPAPAPPAPSPPTYQLPGGFAGTTPQPVAPAAGGQALPYNYLNSQPTPSGGALISSTSITGGILGAIAGGLTGLLGGGSASPGGAPLNLGNYSTGIGNMLDVPFRDITPQGSAALFEAFRPTLNGAVPQNHIAVNPATNKSTWFGPLGKPLLWSRDLQTVRRVRKLAGRARRVAGGR